MKFFPTILAALFVLSACTNTAMQPSNEAADVANLRAEIETLQEAKKIAELKLQEEMQRADAQLFLVRQELAGLRRQLAATRERCGQACAEGQ